jgi:hypothetical protein
MEIEMIASRLSPTAALAGAAIAALVLLASPSFAKDRDGQIYSGGADGATQSQSRAHLSGGSYSGYPTPEPDDFVSSHVCVNGYRWITRERGGWQSPAENAIPVPCN